MPAPYRTGHYYSTVMKLRIEESKKGDWMEEK